MTVVYITKAQVAAAHACEHYLELFERYFGNRIAVTKTNVEKYLVGRGAHRNFNDRSYWLRRLLSMKGSQRMTAYYYQTCGKPRFDVLMAHFFWKVYREEQLKKLARKRK